MQAEMEEMAFIRELANTARTESVRLAVKAMKESFKKEVYCTWSDLKPVYVHLPTSMVSRGSTALA